MVSGKTKNDEDYSSTILYNNEKELQKITDAAKKQNGVKLTIKEKQSVFVNKLSTLIPVVVIALLFIFFLSHRWR